MLHRLAKHGERPEQTAFAFSMGVFIGFTPTIGLHLVTAVIVAWFLRLNMAALVTGSLINNPWTIAPIYSACLWVGLLVVGGDEPLPAIEWNLSATNFFESLAALVAQLKPFILPFVVGTLIMGTLAACASYPLFYRIARRRAMKKKHGGEPQKNSGPES